MFLRDSGMWPKPYPFAGARLTQPATPGQGSPLRSDERLTDGKFVRLALAQAEKPEFATKGSIRRECGTLNWNEYVGCYSAS